MLAYIWPIILVVFSNLLYQICAKSVPGNVNPLATLTITYAVAAVFSGILFLILAKDTTLLKEYSKVNWSSFVLGMVIVGLEVGLIYAYKLGWPVSTTVIVQSSFLAVGLLVVGKVLFHESLGWNKIAGVLICLGGLVIINYK